MNYQYIKEKMKLKFQNDIIKMNQKTKIAAIKAALKNKEYDALIIIANRLSDDEIDYLTSRTL